MSGSIEGGRKAAAKNLAKDPDFYRKIGAKGGKNGDTGGFAQKAECLCDEYPYPHTKPMCAGAKGGRISRKPPVIRDES